MYRTRRENFPLELLVSPAGVSSLFSPDPGAGDQSGTTNSSGLWQGPCTHKATEDLGGDCHREMLGLISLKTPNTKPVSMEECINVILIMNTAVFSFFCPLLRFLSA